jgi:hypothetical protein
VIALVWRPPRIAAYYANLRDFSPSNAPLRVFSIEVAEAPSIALVVSTRSLLGSADLKS